MSRAARPLLVLCGMAALVTVACSAPTDRAAPSAPSASAPSGPNDVGADLPAPSAYPTDDAASRTAAETVAAAAMASFVRVDLTAEDWLSQLSTHLTADAAIAYYGTDPLEVPARAVTGMARWDGSTSAYLADVVVPTEVGDYRLLLVRDGRDSPWLVQTITPPDSVR